jgi:hypothetical protein
MLRSRPTRPITDVTIERANPDCSITLPNTAPSRNTGRVVLDESHHLVHEHATEHRATRAGSVASTASSAQMGAKRMTLKPRYATNIRRPERSEHDEEAHLEPHLIAARIGEVERQALLLELPQQLLVAVDERPHQIAHGQDTFDVLAANDRKMADPLAGASVNTHAGTAMSG